MRVLVKEQSDQGLHCLPFCLQSLEVNLFAIKEQIAGLPAPIAQWFECLLWERYVIGSRLGRAITKAIKMVLAVSFLMLATKGSARKIQEGR